MILHKSYFEHIVDNLRFYPHLILIMEAYTVFNYYILGLFSALSIICDFNYEDTFFLTFGARV